MNFSHISHPDEDLMHYGVRGMKWGVRRGKRHASSGGVGRLKGQKLDRDARHKKYYKDVLNKKSKRNFMAGGLWLNALPKARREAVFNRRIDKIDQRSDRMRNGRTSVMDALQTAGGLAMSPYGAGAFITVKPKDD